MKRRRLLVAAKIMPAALIIFVFAQLGVLVPGRAAADDAMEARHLVDRAQQTLENFARAEEMQGFRNLIKDAQGVFVAPQILKGAFIVGASGGSGVLIARDTLTGLWIGPAFYTIGAASFGLQIGGSASEVVLVIMTGRGVNALMESSIKLGADVGVAAGPVGIGAAASTANLSADIVSFSRSKGLYGGISLDGAVIKTRNDWNNAYYRTIVTPSDVFRKRAVTNPQSAGLIEAVSTLADGVKPLGREVPKDQTVNQPLKETPKEGEENQPQEKPAPSTEQPPAPGGGDAG